LAKCSLLFPQPTFDETTLFDSQARPQNPFVSRNVLPVDEMLERFSLQHHRSLSRRQFEFANATLFLVCGAGQRYCTLVQYLVDAEPARLRGR
jgi:hypothetical protein